MSRRRTPQGREIGLHRDRKRTGDGGFFGFGRLGVLAESIAAEVVRDAREYLVSRAVAGEHLTDQLMLPLALAGEGSFTAMKLSRHATTNRDVISMFLPVRFQVDESTGCCVVRVRTQ